MQSTELSDVIDRMRAGVRGEADDDALLVPVSDIRVILSALSSLATGDVREELIQVLDVSDPDGGVFEPSPEALEDEWGKIADAILTQFDVRLRGQRLQEQAGAAVQNARAILSDPDGVSHRDAVKAIRRLLAAW